MPYSSAVDNYITEHVNLSSYTHTHTHTKQEQHMLKLHTFKLNTSDCTVECTQVLVLSVLVLLL